MCAALDLEPQFDRQRILRLMIRANALLHSLIDDIEIELGGGAECNRLMNEGRRLQQLMLHDTPIAREGTYEEVVRRFENFTSKWRLFSSKLYGIPSPHMQRRMGRIRSVGGTIAEILWLTPSIDYEYAQHVSTLMMRQVGNLFDQMTVNELISLPVNEQTRLLNLAAQMKTDCERLCVCVKRKDKVGSLRDHYVSINKQWAQIEPFMTRVNSKRVVKCTSQINTHSTEIQRMFGVRQAVNRNQLLQLAAELELMSNQFNNRIVRLNSTYKTREFRQRANNCANDFQNQCKSFHQAVSQTRDIRRLRDSCRGVIKSWNELNIVVNSLPQNGVQQSRLTPILDCRQETVGIVAEVAAYLTD